MALGTTNITTTLVGQTIGVASRDVGTLCSSSLINKWSKYKPVVYPVISTTGIANWWKSYGGDCGLTIPTYSDIDLLAEAVESGVSWVYNRPTGGASQPFRLGDFRGYEHAATSPFHDIYVQSKAYNNSSTSKLEIAIYAEASRDYQLYIGDFTIRNYYFGAYMKKASGSLLYPRYLTASTPLIDGGDFIEMPINGLPDGTYYVYPFLASDVRASIDDPLTSNTFVAIDSFPIYSVTIADSPLTINIMGGWRNDDYNSGIIDVTIYIINESSAITMLNCFIYARFGDKAYTDTLAVGEKQDSLGSISVAANTTTTITHTFNVKYSYSSSGWNIWFSSASPYSIQRYSAVMDVE